LLAPLDEWAKAGVFEQLQAVLLDELGEAGRIDLERVSVDSSACGRSKGGPDRRQSRRSGQARVQAAPGRRGGWAAAVSRGERGQRQRLDHAGGRPGGHPGDPDAHRPPAAPPGQGAWRQAYDHRRCRAYLRRRGIRPRIARRRIESSTRLGRHRWTIERTGAWLGGFRRLRIRYERDSERFYALAMLACAVICFNALQQPPWP
jgi:transposase